MADSYAETPQFVSRTHTTTHTTAPPTDRRRSYSLPSPQCPATAKGGATVRPRRCARCSGARHMALRLVDDVRALIATREASRSGRHAATGSQPGRLRVLCHATADEGAERVHGTARGGTGAALEEDGEWLTHRVPAGEPPWRRGARRSAQQQQQQPPVAAAHSPSPSTPIGAPTTHATQALTQTQTQRSATRRNAGDAV